jgi:hypothetical protein
MFPIKAKSFAFNYNCLILDMETSHGPTTMRFGNAHDYPMLPAVTGAWTQRRFRKTDRIRIHRENDLKPLKTMQLDVRKSDQLAEK